MQLAKTVCFLLLSFHFILLTSCLSSLSCESETRTSLLRQTLPFHGLLNCRCACHCPVCFQKSRSSRLKSSARSSGKNILAFSTSTRRFVPGIVSASQWDHFTSKRISSVPQPMRVGESSIF